MRPPGAQTRAISQALLGVGDVPQSEGNGHDLKPVVGKGETLRVGLDKVDRGLRARVRLRRAMSECFDFADADPQHLVREVGPDDANSAAGPTPEGDGQIARSGADVENRQFAFNRRRTDALPAPVEVGAGRQKVVEEVVPG